MTRRGRRVRRPARYCSILTPGSPSVSSHRMDRWTCPHCQREFNQRTNLRRHLRTACPELVSTRPYSCERGCGSKFYRPDMRDRHQRHCSHALIGQVRVEDPDALEIFASDEEMEGSAPPTEPVSSLSCPPEGAAQTRLWTPAAGGTSPRVPFRRRGRGPGGRLDQRDHTDPPSGVAPGPRAPAAAAAARPAPLHRSVEVGTQTEVELPAPGWSGGRRSLPPGSWVMYAGGGRLRLDVGATLQEERTTREASTDMDPPLCEHLHDQWRMEVAPAGLDPLGHRRFRASVTHTYEVPGRMLYTYGGERYAQFGVDAEHAGQPSLGGFLPPGAPPPTRYPEHIPTQFWECLFRQTEVQRGPPPPAGVRPPGAARRHQEAPRGAGSPY